MNIWSLCSYFIAVTIGPFMASHVLDFSHSQTQIFLFVSLPTSLFFCKLTQKKTEDSWNRGGLKVTWDIDIRNTKEAVWGPQHSTRLLYWPRPLGPRSVWWLKGVLWPEYCLWGVSYFYYPTIPFSSVYFLFALFSDEPEVFLPEYSQPAILHAAHFRRVVTFLLARLN